MQRRDLFAGAAAFALLGAHPLAAADLRLNEPGMLSAATEGTFPPFSFRTPAGELDGFEIKVMREISRRLGLTYKPVVIKWESLLVGLLAGQYDMSSNPMGITAERQKQVLFCDAWVESGAKLVVRADSAIKQPADAKGRTIGVIVASTFVPLAEKLGGEVRTYKADPDALTDLANGNIDSVITDAVAGAYAIKTAGLPLRLLDGYLDSYQMGWAVTKERPELVRAINAALAAMVKDGTFGQIALAEIGLDPTPREPIRSQL